MLFLEKFLNTKIKNRDLHLQNTTLLEMEKKCTKIRRSRTLLTNIRVIHIFILTLLLQNCTLKKEPTTVNLLKLDSLTQKTISEFGITASTRLSLIDNKLLIHIDYLNDYFLLEGTEKLIKSFVLASFDSLVNSVDTTIMFSTYKDLVDSTESIYTKEIIQMYQDELVKNPLFKEMVTYSLREFNSTDDIALETITDDLRSLVPNKFQHNGGFWVLLYNYTLSCCDSTSNAYKSMYMFSHATHYPEYQVRPEVIDSIIKYCEKKCKD